MTIGGKAATDASEDEAQDQNAETQQDNQELDIAEMDGSGDSR